MISGYKVTTKVIFRNNSDEILILKKENNPSLTWDLPGGTLETNEQIAECIIREINEELGITVDFSDLKLFNVYVVNRIEKRSLLVLVYTCQKQFSNFILSEEHSKYIYANEKKILDLKEKSVIFDILEDINNDKNK
ncbi:MAG: NUDIX domain-containing protein [Bacilli bacterium]